MPKKIKYYDISNLLSTEAQYMMLLGQRANGKSYQAKKTVLEHFIETGEKFVYLRRWQADIKIKAINKYFEDMPISKITNKQYIIYKLQKKIKIQNSLLLSTLRFIDPKLGKSSILSRTWVITSTIHILILDIYGYSLVGS